MSFDKVCELADNFIIKLAEEQYINETPADIKSTDLTWLDEEERALIKMNGKNDKYLPHNPPSSVTSEKIWDRAKKAVKKYWKKYDEPWGAVFNVYKQMGGKTKGKKKK